MWALVCEFRQRNISMAFCLTADLGQAALPGLITHLRKSPHSRVCLFVNTVEDGRKWSNKLGDLIAVADIDVFVLEINGEMDKNEKCAVARLFTNATRLAGLSPCVLVGTSAANHGIDQPDTDLVLRSGTARGVITVLQERGRNCRKPGTSGCYDVYFGWRNVTNAAIGVLTGHKSSAGSSDCAGMNSVIASLTNQEQ